MTDARVGRLVTMMAVLLVLWAVVPKSQRRLE